MTSFVPTPDLLKPGVMLRHYKGGLYQVVGMCRIEATLAAGVLYKARQGDEEITWMRPLVEFHDTVSTAEGRVPRFSVIGSAL